MKKIILIVSLFLYGNAYSQVMTLINNTADVINVQELWVNDFSTHFFPAPLVYQDIASSANAWIAPFSSTTVHSFVPLDASCFDFEYVKLGVYDVINLTTPITTQDLGTDATMYHIPSRCEPLVSPATLPMPSPAFSGIKQVILPEVLSLPPAPTAISIIVGAKAYRMTWFTIYNTITDKYDVEITIN